MAKPDLRYVVLSERNSAEGDLREGIQSLLSAWTRLRRLLGWKQKVKGCLIALEVTWRPKTRSWHPHLNVLFEGDYFPQKELVQLWKKATRGCGAMVHIKAANAGTVRELIKYVTKIADLVGEPAALDEFLTAVKSKRLVRTYGTFFGITVDDEENAGCECVECERAGRKDVSVVDLGYVPAYQVSLDFETGILRVDRNALPQIRPGKLCRFQPLPSVARSFDALFKPFEDAHRAAVASAWNEYFEGNKCRQNS